MINFKAQDQDYNTGNSDILESVSAFGIFASSDTVSMDAGSDLEGRLLSTHEAVSFGSSSAVL